MDLCTFYRRQFCATYHAAASPRTVAEYETALNVWRDLAGSPDLAELDAADLAKINGRLARRGGSPHTRNKHRRALNHLLTTAGPPSPKHRDALGLVDRYLWLRYERAPVRMPKACPDAVAKAWYQAAGAADRPGRQPATWWRAYLVAAYSLALRRGTLLRLTWQHIDLTGGLVNIPAEIDKAGRDRIKPLCSTARRHLLTIRQARGLVFDFDAGRSAWYRHFDQIRAAAAKIDSRAEDFTTHDLKRSAALALRRAGGDPWQIRYLLDHAQADTSGRHYIELELEGLADLAERMAQPWIHSGRQEARPYQAGGRCN